MKKLLTVLRLSLIFTFVFVFIQAADAQKPKKRLAHYLNRTNIVLRETGKQLKINKVYTGYYSKAVRHQKHAVRLFHKGLFNKAYHHSHRARVLARLAYEANLGVVPNDWKDTNDESASTGTTPSDEELDAELTEADSKSEAEWVEEQFPDVN